MNFYEIASLIEKKADHSLVKRIEDESIFKIAYLRDGTIAEAMLALLRTKTQYRYDEGINCFAKKCSHYIGVAENDWEEPEINNLYSEFERLFNCNL